VRISYCRSARRYRHAVFSRLTGWCLICMKHVEVIDLCLMYTINKLCTDFYANVWHCSCATNLKTWPFCVSVIVEVRRRYRRAVFSRLAGWCLIFMKHVEVIDLCLMYTSKKFETSMLIFDTVVVSQTSKLGLFVRIGYCRSAATVPSCGIQPFSRMMFDFHKTCGSDRSLSDVYHQQIWDFYLNACPYGSTLK